jgi:Glycosyl transferases group 1
MSERGRQMLEQTYAVPADQIDVIPHGIPDMPFVDPNFYKDELGVEGKRVLLTFGLLSPGKGVEHVIRALPEIVKEFPDLVYIVLGATHPNLRREQGEIYRLSLERLASELDVKKHVLFYNRFVEPEELQEFVGAADIYIAPHIHATQITSGTLAYAFGCGKAVMATPYWHAQELLADGRGVLVPFGDSGAIARELSSLLKDDIRRHAMRKQAYLLGREMVWNRVTPLFVESFERARLARMERIAPQLAIRKLQAEPRELPELRLDHLRRLSDATGVFHHAKYSLPKFDEGYCTDDAARALLLTVMLEETGDNTPDVRLLASTYSAFLNHAFIFKTRRFHNFMSFDRRWLDEDGSDLCYARALLALATCIARSQREDLRRWAIELFNRALPAIENTTSPRAWALGVVAIHEYFRQFSGDRVASRIRDALTQRLIGQFQAARAHDWPWFETELSRDNACLPHALILSGRWTSCGEAFDIGMCSLRWLMGVQTAEAGHFRPIGSNGFYRRGGTRAYFDQQPTEAWSSVAACIDAQQGTGEEFWLKETSRAFEWFLGGNDLGLPLYDASSGGCFDGLQVDHIDLNQGAESTLSFLLSLQEMRRLEGLLKPAVQPIHENLDLERLNASATGSLNARSIARENNPECLLIGDL